MQIILKRISRSCACFCGKCLPDSTNMPSNQRPAWQLPDVWSHGIARHHVVTWWLAGALPESAMMTAVWVQGPIACSLYASIGAQTCGIHHLFKDNVTATEANLMGPKGWWWTMESFAWINSDWKHWIAPGEQAAFQPQQHALKPEAAVLCFQLTGTRWHESSTSNFAQVRCVMTEKFMAWHQDSFQAKCWQQAPGRIQKSAYVISYVHEWCI